MCVIVLGCGLLWGTWADWRRIVIIAVVWNGMSWACNWSISFTGVIDFIAHDLWWYPMHWLSQWFLQRYRWYILFTGPIATIFSSASLISINHVSVLSHDIATSSALQSAVFLLLHICTLIASLLLVDSVLDELAEPLDWYMSLLAIRQSLISDKPCKHIFVGIQTTLLIRNIVALTWLFVQLGETIGSLLKWIF